MAVKTNKSQDNKPLDMSYLAFLSHSQNYQSWSWWHTLYCYVCTHKNKDHLPFSFFLTVSHGYVGKVMLYKVNYCEKM